MKTVASIFTIEWK